MTLLPGPAPSTVGRLGSILLSAGLAALLILFAAACAEGTAKEPTPTSGAPATGADATTPDAAPQGGTAEASPQERTATAPVVVTIYSSPTCGCCHEYAGYLEAEGFEVESITTEDFAEIKERLAIPPDMQSCHTTIIQDYYVEGHVPVEAIRKLLEEQPAIDGIALPGMPSGSPGMGGDKAQPFIIYSIVDDTVDEFMTL